MNKSNIKLNFSKEKYLFERCIAKIIVKSDALERRMDFLRAFINYPLWSK
jgi:hypothetical protein